MLRAVKYLHSLGLEHPVKMLCDRSITSLFAKKKKKKNIGEQHTVLTAYLKVGLKILVLSLSVISQPSAP